MARDVVFSQLKKYDINQKILAELADLVSRNVMLSIVKKPMSVLDIATKNNIPISSVYQKLKTLEELSLVFVEKEIVDLDGKKTRLYRSMIKEASIRIEDKDPKIDLEPNKIKSSKNQVT
ncbi:MAG: ArsR family transcriptional regulator [Nitrosopumilaceae archaeon]|nr:helix-turn-helix transcriptional regulator [Nitrosopumilaceae archaeon]NIU00053.1 helix-turn-helix transcriptional regulator [Nitrosopumilaceae archaeon]NIU86432.1 ArsR family transcriptional regulator [Nitrosopumilaceae archaeon]NIV65141.1 ArsR family transcriptional regulator [Nitrosopumilaceae archaeon]NIX60655.1 ArsR family transcriptional regulator [Nitrosopumilaceae archaeon]